MTDIFSCTEDGSAPKEIKDAGKAGLLQVNSIVGWVDLGDDFDYVRNNCEYRIKADWIQTKERLPTRFDSLHEDNHHIDCYIFIINQVIERPWNIHHECWDDKEYDDFEFNDTAPSHWMIANPLPEPPKAN